MQFDYKPTDGKFLDILIEWGGGIKKWVTDVRKIEITGEKYFEKRYLVTFTDHLGRQCETSVPLRSVAEVSFFEKDTPSSQELLQLAFGKMRTFEIEKVQKVLYTDFTVEEVLQFLMLKKLRRMVEKPYFA